MTIQAIPANRPLRAGDQTQTAAELAEVWATEHQREAGTGYLDAVSSALNPDSATLALVGSTESQQFH